MVYLGGFKEFSKNFPLYCVQKEKILICSSVTYMNNSEDEFKYAIENAKMSKILDYLYLGRLKR